MLLSRILGTATPGSNIRAATPENPSFDLNSPDAWDALGGERSSTGQAISAESALKFSAWWRGVNFLARTVAKCPLHVYKTANPETDYGSSWDRNHPAFRLLHSKPNELMTAFNFKLTLTGHAVNRGNGYAYILRNGGGDPLELLPLDPDGTTPLIVDGQLWYVTAVGAERRKMPAADVYHVRGFGFDGIQGYPAYKMAREAIGLSLAAQKFKATRFRNAARPSVVLQTPNKMLPATRQELRQDWERMHTGLDNAHRTAILDNGLTAAPLSYTAEEMQEVEQAGLTIRDAANFLGIPSSKLGDVAGVKYASKEQDDQNAIDDGVDFWFRATETEAADKLLSEQEKKSGTHIVAFDRESLIAADMTTRANYYRTATGGRPWMTPAEVRDKLHLDPIDDPDANKLLTPLNMGQGGPDNKPTDAPPATPPGPPDPPVSPPAKKKQNTAPNHERERPSIDFDAVRAAASSALADAARRMVRRVATHAERAAKEPAKFCAFVDTIQADHATVFSDALSPGVQMAAAAVGHPCWSADPAANELIRILTSEFNAAAEAHSAKTLPGAVAAMAADQETRIPAMLATFVFEGT